MKIIWLKRLYRALGKNRRYTEDKITGITLYNKIRFLLNIMKVTEK